MGAYVSHDLEGKYPAEILPFIPGSDGLASGRPWCLTHRDDVITIPRGLRAHLPYVGDHYARIGLPVTQQIVWDTDAPVEVPSGMVPSALCTDNPQRTYHLGIGDKNAFMRLCAKLVVVTPITYFSDKMEYLCLPFPFMYKRAIGGCGIGVVHCATPEDVHAAIREHGTYYQLQEMLSATAWLTVQCITTRGTTQHLATTEQLLEGYSHVGDTFPTPYDVWSVIAPLAEHLAQCGVRDMLEFNVAVVPQAEGHAFLPVSCKRGMGSALYPTLLCYELGASAWSARTLYTTRRTFDGLDLTGIEYDCTRRCGIVLVNWGLIETGRLNVACYGTSDEQRDLYRLLEERL